MENASLGELRKIQSHLDFGFADGFAVTTHLYDHFISHNNLDKLIDQTLEDIDYDQIGQIKEGSQAIRSAITQGTFTDQMIQDTYLARFESKGPMRNQFVRAMINRI